MHRLLTGRSCVGTAAVSWLKYLYRDDETNKRVDWIFSTVFVFKMSAAWDPLDRIIDSVYHA